MVSTVDNNNWWNVDGNTLPWVSDVDVLYRRSNKKGAYNAVYLTRLSSLVKDHMTSKGLRFRVEHSNALSTLVVGLNHAHKHNTPINVKLHNNRAMSAMVEALEELKLIDAKHGTGHMDAFNGQSGHTTKLRSNFDPQSDLWLDIVPFRVVLDECLLNNKKAKKITVVKKDRSIKILKKYNTFANQQDVSVVFKGDEFKSSFRDCGYEDVHYLKGFIGAKRLNPSLTRMYTNEIDRGGRLYARDWVPYQNLPSVLRDEITINGNATCECDFSSLHINLLYAENNLQFEGDAYIQSESERAIRSILKLAVLRAVGGKKIHQTIRGVKEDLHAISSYDVDSNDANESKMAKAYNEVCYFYSSDNHQHIAEQIVEKFLTRHDVIRSSFHNDRGVYLQKLDSDIMLDILDQLREIGILGLPVHDSVIVEEKHQATLLRIMTDTYKKHTGFTINVDVK